MKTVARLQDVLARIDEANRKDPHAETAEWG